jgi:hypothetical protein
MGGRCWVWRREHQPWREQGAAADSLPAGRLVAILRELAAQYGWKERPVMNRVLRAFALAEALAWVIYGVIYAIITHRSVTVEGVSTSLMLMNLVALTGFYIGVVAGIVAVVACLQQRRWVWAAALVLLVIVSLYLDYLLYVAYIFFPSVVIMTVRLSASGSRVAFQLFPGLALTLVVLASTFWPRRIAVE